MFRILKIFSEVVGAIQKKTMPAEEVHSHVFGPARPLSYLDDGVQILPRCGRRVDDRRRAHGYHSDVMGQDRLSRCGDNDRGVMRWRRRRRRSQDLSRDEQFCVKTAREGAEETEYLIYYCCETRRVCLFADKK